MTATRSTRAARTENMTAKLAFRGCRAVAAAAAVIAFGLLAAPAYADHVKYNATVTLAVTVGTDGSATLNMSYSPLNTDPRQQTGFQFRERQQSDGDWNGADDGWETLGSKSTHTIQDFLGTPPFYVQVRAWNMRKIDGEWHGTVSDPSAEVEVNPSQ